MIKVCGVAFQALTVNCAKCHDHKFDAITARDYYSFYGMLRSSRLHYANIANPERKKEVAARLRGAKKDLMADVFRSVEKEAAGIEQEGGKPIPRWFKEWEQTGLVEICSGHRSLKQNSTRSVFPAAQQDDFFHL